VKAQILDGALAGTKHVVLHFISLAKSNERLVVRVPMVDSNVLERVTEP
jgi:hypothetical protein